MEIGGGFTSFFEFGTVVADSSGKAAVPINIVQGGLPPLTTLYWQCVTFVGAPSVPLDTTNSINVFYF